MKSLFYKMGNRLDLPIIADKLPEPKQLSMDEYTKLKVACNLSNTLLMSPLATSQPTG